MSASRTGWTVAQELARDHAAGDRDDSHGEVREGVDWHYGPDPAFGFMTKHVGPREHCSGPDCGPDEGESHGDDLPHPNPYTGEGHGTQAQED